MRRWISLQTLKRGWYRFWKDSRHISSHTWWRWAGTLGLGLGICAGLTLTMTIVAKAYVDQGLQGWDSRWLVILADRIPLSFSRAVTWESPGNSLGVLPIVGGFIGIMVMRSQPLLVATMAAAYSLQFALVWIGWGYWNRDRPDLIADGIAASGLHSFPSGHIVVVITVYGLLTYLWCWASHSWIERGLVAMAAVLWIAMIASSRLVLGAHWPSDVIAGIAIGMLWLLTVIVALHRVWR